MRAIRALVLGLVIVGLASVSWAGGRGVSGRYSGGHVTSHGYHGRGGYSHGYGYGVPYGSVSAGYYSGDFAFRYSSGYTYAGGPYWYTTPYVYATPRVYYPYVTHFVPSYNYVYPAGTYTYYTYRPYTLSYGAYAYRPRYPAADDAVHGAIGVDRALGPASKAWLVPSHAGPDDQPVRLDGLTPPPFAPEPEQRTVVVTEAGQQPVPREQTGADMALLKRTWAYGNESRTESAFRGELSKHPNDPRVYYAYAYAFFVHRKYFPATLVLRRGLALDRSLAGDPSVLAGFYDARTTAASLKELNSYLAAHPNDTDVLMLRGWIHLMEGRLDDARVDLNMVLRTRADDPEIASLLAATAP